MVRWGKVGGRKGDGVSYGRVHDLPPYHHHSPTIRPITTLDSPFAPLGGSEKDEEKGVSGK